jgi:uncharacterized protein (DUF4415 family)
MQRKGNFARYTADELSQPKSETDWAKADAMTREEIERQAEADDGPLPEGWEDTVVLGVPGRKRGVYLRLDPNVLNWFRAHGPGYQTRINAVLRASTWASPQPPSSIKKARAVMMRIAWCRPSANRSLSPVTMIPAFTATAVAIT